MVYSAWKSPGFGVCGHKNQYSKQVKIGNFVEDLEHFNDEKSKIKYKNRYMSENHRSYEKQDGRNEEEANKQEKRFEALAREFSKAKMGVTYGEILNLTDKKTDYKTHHERAFGKREIELSKLNARKTKIGLVKLTGERKDFLKNTPTFNECNENEETSYRYVNRDFSNGFLIGSHVKRD